MSGRKSGVLNNFWAHETQLYQLSQLGNLASMEVFIHGARAAQQSLWPVILLIIAFHCAKQTVQEWPDPPFPALVIQCGSCPVSQRICSGSRICSGGTCTLADLFRFSRNSADLFRVFCFDQKLLRSKTQ